MSMCHSGSISTINKELLTACLLFAHGVNASLVTGRRSRRKSADGKTSSHRVLPTVPPKMPKLRVTLPSDINPLPNFPAPLALGAFCEGTLGLRALRPRLAYDGPLALRAFATN